MRRRAGLGTPVTAGTEEPLRAEKEERAGVWEEEPRGAGALAGV